MVRFYIKSSTVLNLNTFFFFKINDLFVLFDVQTVMLPKIYKLTLDY